MDPDISVLIPAFNEEAHLGQAIESVRRSFESVGRNSYEIVACDNNSTDLTAEVARSNDARVVFEPHNQIARARNAAAKASLGKWLIFLDADTQMNAEVLRQTMSNFESGKVGAGGAVVTMDEEVSLGARWFVALWNQVSIRFRLAAGSYIYCLREAWSDTGGFDERYYASEEIWFSRKLHAWCRGRGLEFRVIGNPPIVTSARKLKWFSKWQLWKQFFRCMDFRSMRDRKKCPMWYERPGKKL